MGTQLPRLALLLAVLQYAAVQSAPPAPPIAQLLTNGGRFFLKAYADKGYLTGQTAHFESSASVEAGQPGDSAHWTFVQTSDTTVALRAANGKFLQHESGNDVNLGKGLDDAKWWTPVDNGDGTWSFKTRWNPGWLSAHRSDRQVEAVNNNARCERWRLEPWHPRDTLMAELLANGGRYFLKAYGEKGYLTGQVDHSGTSVSVQAQSPGDVNHWTIVQVGDTEVAIRAANGKFIKHDRRHRINLEDKADDWEFWTPLKNQDGSWSFRSRYDKWLSAHREDRWAEAVKDNQRCEKFRLEPWQLGPTMTELLAHGGRYRLKACTGKYLTGRWDDSPFFCGKSTSVLANSLAPLYNTQWTIVQTSDTEVALRSHDGKFLRHEYPVDLVGEAQAWEKWTPVKNKDGSWSFKSRYEPGWLSAGTPSLKGRFHVVNDRMCDFGYIVAAEEKKGCEQWKLTEWP